MSSNLNMSSTGDADGTITKAKYQGGNLRCLALVNPSALPSHSAYNSVSYAL
jgi:hypothetical protein